MGKEIYEFKTPLVKFKINRPTDNNYTLTVGQCSFSFNNADETTFEKFLNEFQFLTDNKPVTKTPNDYRCLIRSIANGERPCAYLYRNRADRMYKYLRKQGNPYLKETKEVKNLFECQSVEEVKQFFIERVKDRDFKLVPSEQDSNSIVVLYKGKSIGEWYGEKGALAGIEQYKQMLEAGFTDLAKYIAYSNELSQKKAIDIKQKELDLLKPNTDPKKGLVGDYSKMSSKAIGKLNVVLSKQYKHKGKLLTLRHILESGEYISVIAEEINAIQFNRNKYNRMTSEEQELYDKRLEDTKIEYKAVTKKNTYMKIPKLVYDFYKKNEY